MNSIIIPIIVTAVVFLFIAGLTSLISSLFDKKRKTVRRRLDQLTGTANGPLILERGPSQQMSEVPWLARLMEKSNHAEKLAKLVRQSKAPGSPALYLLLSLFLAVMGGYSAYLYTEDFRTTIGLALPLGWLPFWWLKRRLNTRMTLFQSQLADALDLVARSMKAGHTFTGGMRMAVDEFADPIAEELGQTLDEINYGMDVDAALSGLLERVDCPDLKFFVVSVNVQRETGGNLAEIIATISGLIRERFKLFGKIRVLSAEGRFSAWILLALPFVITGILWLLNKDYIEVLFVEDVGKSLIWGALGSMAMGFIIIRRMIRIKV